MSNFNKGKKDYTAGVSEMGGQTEKAAGSFEILSKGLGGIVAVAGTVISAVYALDKALEFARAGAAIKETTRSFDRLMKSLGQGPDVLRDLQRASRGTVDDMTLMSSTLALVAGASDTLAAEIVANAPQLLEIAKATNKLNPALGTTSFMFESLAIGIKRAQPLIIDNTGLTLKVGAANEKYAAQIGKTVEALTAEDKQIALLYGTLEAGRVVIDQVGGDTESATDAFDRLTVSVKNAGDEMKTRLVPTMTSVADGLSYLLDILSGQVPFAFREAAQEAQSAGGSFIDMASAANEAKISMQRWPEIHMGKMILEGDELVAILGQMGASSDEIVKTADALGIELPNAFRQSYAEAARWARGMDAAADASEDLGDEVDKTTITLEEQAAAIKLATDRVTEALGQLNRVTSGIQTKLSDFYGALGKGIGGLNDFGKASKKAAKDYKKSVSDINADAAKAYADIKKKAEESLPDPTTVAERLKMAGDAWDEWGLRLQDIIEHGADSERYDDLSALIEKPPDIDPAAWAAKLKKMFYSGELEDLINKSAGAWIDHKDTATQAMNEETEAVRAATAEQLAIAAEAKAEADRQRKEERKDFILMTALKLADALGLLKPWAEETQGALATAFDTPEEVFDGLKSNILALDPALQEIISGGMTGLLTSFKTLKTDGEKTQPVLDEMFVKAQKDSTEAAANIKNLTSDLADLETQLEANDLLSLLPKEDAEAATADITAAIDEIQGKLDELGGDEEGAESLFVQNFHDWWVKVAEDALPLVETAMSKVEIRLNALQQLTGTQTSAMAGDWEGLADDITEYFVGNSAFPDLIKGLGGFETATNSAIGRMGPAWNTLAQGMFNSWKTAANDAVTEIEKIGAALDGIPRTMTIEITYAEAPPRQHGGPVLAGHAYTVGEAGPETFVPNRPGTILPNMSSLTSSFRSMLGQRWVSGTNDSRSYGGDTIILNVTSPAAWGVAQRWVDTRRSERLNRGM